MRIERIDRIDLELGTQWKTQYHVEDGDPLSALAELHQTQTLSRGDWQIRVEMELRLSSTGHAFLVQAGLRAFRAFALARGRRAERHQSAASIPISRQ